MQEPSSREEEQGADRPVECTSAADLLFGWYTMTCAFMYSLSFSMPFWTEDLSTPDSQAHDGEMTPDPAGNRSHHHSSREVWRYSWEYVGLALRCQTLLLLLCGLGVWLYRRCCSSSGNWRQPDPLPPFLPIVCAIVGGVMGIYAELVLWLGVYLLAPNPLLMSSQVFCSACSLFCFCVGLILRRTVRGRSDNRVIIRGIYCQDSSDNHRRSHSNMSAANPFHEDDATFPETHGGGRSVAAATEERTWAQSAQGLSDVDGSPSDHSQEDEVDKRRLETLGSLLSDERCPEKDRPSNLQQKAEEGSRDPLPDHENRFEHHPPKKRSNGLPRLLPNGTEGKPTKESLEDVHDLLPKGGGGGGSGGGASSSEVLMQSGDFHHSTRYIDDDLYYHSSDDDHLERFILSGNNSLLQQQQQRQRQQQQQFDTSSESRVSCNSTTRLLHTERAFLRFGGSEEYHSFSDEDSKNKTWP